MRKSPIMEQREKANMAALTERYYGKKDLLDTWDESSLRDVRYRNDLARRVRGHRHDILYRGGEIIEDNNNGHNQ